MESFLTKIDPHQITAYQEKLKFCGIADITSCFSKEMIGLLAKETRSVFEEKSKRKDFLSVLTNTPRNMFTVSETDITDTCSIIKDFYYSTELLNFLSTIAAEAVNFLPGTGERYSLMVYK